MVRFTSSLGVLVPLEIHVEPERANLRDLYALLFELRVQIVRVAENRSDDGRVLVRLDVCEFDGGPLSPRRRLAITQTLTAVLEGPAPRPRAA